MDSVNGIPGQVPALAPFPTPEVRRSLPPEEWQSCLDAWSLAVDIRLRLMPEHFQAFKFSEASSGLPFLSSYFSFSVPTDVSARSVPLMGDKEYILRHQCLLLSRRLLLEGKTPYDCGAADLFKLLANTSIVLQASKLWKDTLHLAWQRQNKMLCTCVEDVKSDVNKLLALGTGDGYQNVRHSLRQLTALSCCLPEAGKILMTGSDYIESLIGSYNDSPNKLNRSSSEELRRSLIENLYLGLRSLMRSENPSGSLLLDDLYLLKTSAEIWAKTNPNKPILLSNLVCSTSFLLHLESFIAASNNTRGTSILQYLQSYRKKMKYLHPIQRTSRKRDREAKGKAKVTPSRHLQEMHIHKASQISQIHELFPDISTPYVLRLLDHFSNDVEAVTAALLEPESLPAALQDRKGEAAQTGHDPSLTSDLPPDQPSPSFIPRRKNVFDGDEFDRLKISADQVHAGRRERNVEENLSPSDKAKKKAAIMAALATFDSDEDERDDTYDIADVGGAVDNTVDTDGRGESRLARENEDIDTNEQTLFRIWKSDPEIFARDTKTRLSQSRWQLRSETGMTNEQIEGWALILSRDNAQQKKLEHKYTGPTSLGRGQQGALKSSRWSATRSTTAAEEEDENKEKETDEGQQGGRGEGTSSAGQSRGVGGSRGRGIGNSGGPSSTTVPGTRTEGHTAQPGRTRGGDRGRGRGRGRSRGGRGGASAPNHNRREGRAKKMAGRGGFGRPPPNDT